MPDYTVDFYNDMGHLRTYPDYGELPDKIFYFVSEKVRTKINYATDLKNLGCTYYILKEGLQSKWTYQFEDDTVTINYKNLNTFDATCMKMW
jgi:hypothetical protein